MGLFLVAAKRVNEWCTAFSLLPVVTSFLKRRVSGAVAPFLCTASSAATKEAMCRKTAYGCHFVSRSVKSPVLHTVFLYRFHFTLLRAGGAKLVRQNAAGLRTKRYNKNSPDGSGLDTIRLKNRVTNAPLIRPAECSSADGGRDWFTFATAVADGVMIWCKDDLEIVASHFGTGLQYCDILFSVKLLDILIGNKRLHLGNGGCV